VRYQNIRSALHYVITHQRYRRTDRYYTHGTSTTCVSECRAKNEPFGSFCCSICNNL